MSILPAMHPGFVAASCTRPGAQQTPVTGVWEPWQPREGDYVRVRPGPECRYNHDRLIAGRYGRVEMVDYAYDDLAGWIEATADRDGNTDEEEARKLAHGATGHYYYVNDALEHKRTVLLDGNFAALELEPVSEEEARAAIEALRAEFMALDPGTRFLKRIANLMGEDVAEAIKRRALERRSEGS